MTPEHFVYWLQGFLELSESKTLSAKQLQVVRNHLNLVFMHIDMKDPPEKQEALQAAHDGNPLSQLRAMMELLGKDEKICASTTQEAVQANEALDKALAEIRDQLKPLSPNGPIEPLGPTTPAQLPVIEPLAPPKAPVYHRPRTDPRDKRLRC